jgi:hypothetical protein
MIKKVVALIVACFTHAGTIRLIFEYLQFEFFKLNRMFNLNKRAEGTTSNYRGTKTVFAKIPKQHLSPSKRENLEKELELMNREGPLLPDILKFKLMDMAAQPCPDNINFYYFILELLLEYLSTKIQDFMDVELETFSEEDMIYIPIRVDSELFSDEELIRTCNFCKYKDIPLEKRNTIFQGIWSECRMKYGNTKFSGESMGLYTSEVKSIHLVFLLVTDCLEEVELESTAKWETIPIVVNTSSTTLKEVLDDLISFPWVITYRRKRWQIMYAGTRPMSH